MNKQICLLLIFAAVISLLGCSNDKIAEPVTFCYPRKVIEYGSTDGVIATEIREGAGYSSPAELLQLYFSGPENSALENPFPQDLQVLSFSANSTEAQLMVTDQLVELTGAPLVIACNCVAQTVMAMTGVSGVSIRCETRMGEQFTVHS